jgi:hypothetical protein
MAKDYRVIKLDPKLMILAFVPEQILNKIVWEFIWFESSRQINM